MTQTRLLIFDFDGTLVDSEAGIVAAIAQTVRAMGFPETMIEQWRNLIGIPLTDQLRLLLDEGDYERIPAIVAYYREVYNANVLEQTQPIPGMGALLAEVEAAGLRMVIASSKRGGSIELILEHLAWRHYFGAIFSPDVLTHYKPHPESVERALAQFGLPAEAALLIGDTTFDLEMAQAGGVRSCAVTWGVHSREQLASASPNYWADSIEQLRDAIFSTLSFEQALHISS
ncbi:HAD family hydrolase [Leptolyngbya sp. FACHB-261]|uniref:HAD family hydrolase n=1 Tax=Leptolyngbya sp. FACHB-261 TaxID=2692806 RepID=UPI00168790FB|nr:HAD family hydrolase [Leptolyngbya sp. FACHB-261]MBD2099812.1 HAD family hydrolase [Leptolyngbya sp. FACHB-261]